MSDLLQRAMAAYKAWRAEFPTIADAFTQEQTWTMGYMKGLEDGLTEATSRFNAALNGAGASPEPTASSRPVERFTHDVKGNKL